MDSKSNYLSLFTITLLLSLLSHSHVTSSESYNKQSLSPFKFEHLKGCQKGQNVKGIQNLKKYLQKFGYLSHGSHANNIYNNSSDTDDFDDFLESAIKTYQLNYNLSVTGKLDPETVSYMMMPRCGVADIINGASSMRSGKEKHPHYHGEHINIVGHYAFFPGKPKWPRSKYHLTYAFVGAFPAKAKGPVVQAFQKWASKTQFRFRLVRTTQKPDLTVSFHRRDHGDRFPFDGPGGVIAHSFAPTDGRFHYDADELWSVGVVRGAYDLQTVALHEIGHLLGLGHSSVRGAIMYPYISPGTTKTLNRDDIRGIRALYNT